MLLGINVQMDGKMLDWNFKFQIIWEIFGLFEWTCRPTVTSHQSATSRRQVGDKLAVQDPKKKHTYDTYLLYGILLQHPGWRLTYYLESRWVLSKGLRSTSIDQWIG